MSSLFFERITRMGWLIAFFTAAAAAPLLGARWAIACGIGFAWIYLNFFFLMRLMETAAGPKAAAGKRIALFAALKFPVIYLTGFFILKSRYFPVSGILAGLTVFFVSLAAARIGDVRAKTARNAAV